VEVNGEERLVVAAEVEHRFGPRRQKGQKDKGAERFKPKFSQPFNVEETVSSIRQAVSEQHELSVYAVLLLRMASIPKTSSGKIQRSACREDFLAGSGLNILGKWREALAESESQAEQKPQPVSKDLGSQTAETIQNWLLSKISEQLKMTATQIDIREPLARYGLDSATAVSLSGELETWLDRQLSPTLVYDYPNIQALAQYLAAEQPLSKTRANVKQKTANEAIAIIGIGCRFPGANDPEAFWHLLRDGVDAIKEVPASRWDVNTFYDPNPDTPGKMNTRWGGFLDEVAGFDSQFFEISPREAESMDPQQRLLLEVTWEALENAGLAAEQLAGSQTGVFIGISTNDYTRLQAAHGIGIDAYSGSGNAHSIAANRLSYWLDLHGPSWAVDTACSSSLVAVHHACQSLRQGDSELALAGGVNLILSPDLTITFSQAQMLSPEGRCKTFDADANGYVRGEGCGIVILKCLSDALKDGDNILAVIKGTAVNQDGRSNGLTAPNGLAQQVVIRQALANAGVKASEISYVEAHGVGTPLGDSIELNSLKEVLMLGRSADQPCYIGSVKTNIGHLEAAAGIASLIKAVLALQHQEIPPNLHFSKLNPLISIANTPLSIPTTLLPSPDEQKIVGVNTFGFGGTNAHLILASAPISSTEVAKIERPKHLLSLSAKDEQALRALANAYVSYLQSPVQIANLCFTANLGRSHFAHRLAIVANSPEQVQEQLRAFAVGDETVGLVSGKTRNQSPKIAFLFSGQGSQYVGMAHQLYDSQPSFRQTLDSCANILAPYLEKPLLSVINNQLINETVYTQPALFALEYALAKLWQSWGIQASIVMGHGVGEYVAACVAGVFSLEDGLKLIAARGRLMQMVEPMLAEFEQVAAEITYATPKIPLCSNVTGQLATDEIATPAYWVRHVRQPVRFAASMETLYQQGYECFMEIGPKPSLLAMGRQCLPDGVGTWLVSLRQGQDDWEQLLQSLGELYVRGVSVDWAGFDRDYPRRRIQLPTYPFQRQRYWVETVTPDISVVTLSQQDNSISVDDIGKRPEDYLRFAPFMEQNQVFSWFLTFRAPEKYPEHFELVMKAQRQMKEVLFRGVDFSTLTKGLDIGCGYASDLIAFGKQYSHIEWDGCNISSEQIEIGKNRIRACGFQNRIKLHQCDSSKDEFPNQYDLAMGFQVIHHIQDKIGVFANLGRHIKNGGLLILAEIVSNLAEAIEHSESSAYFIPKNEWAELLAHNHLRIVECVDASREIGNFLDDPNFDDNFSRVTQDVDEVTKAHLKGPHLLGNLLRKQLALYCLFTIQKDNYLRQDTILRVNQEKIAALVPYSQILRHSESGEIFQLYQRIDENEGASTLNRPADSLTRETLLTTEPTQRQSLLESYLAQQVARTLKLKPSKQLDRLRPLNRLGLDSLMALELKKCLETELQVDVPMVKFMEGVNVVEITNFLLEQITVSDSTPSASMPTTVSPSHKETKAAPIEPTKELPSENAGQMLAKLHQLTDEEVETLLSSMLPEKEKKS